MKFKIIILLSALLLMFTSKLISQETYLSDNDESLFNSYTVHITPFKSEPMETILQKTAEFFLEIPYVGGTLDLNDNESLVVNLRELDCVTYVENVLALSLAIRNNNLSQSSFVDNLRQIRYRKKKILDFASRIHYTSDWIVENENNNFIENISKKLSGIKETKKLDFMSTHRSAYKQIAKNDSLFNKIVAMEHSVNDRGGFYYIPKQLIASNGNKIPHMSIIAFVTAIPGLDTSHVGFAFHEKGKLTFIHASSAKQKVVIDDKTLSEYCLSQKNCKGVIVAKVL